VFQELYHPESTNLEKAPTAQITRIHVIDPPGGQRVIQRAVAAGELRLQAQLHQRRHRVIRA
jgi:hypothetical protein